METLRKRLRRNAGFPVDQHHALVAGDQKTAAHRHDGVAPRALAVHALEYAPVATGSQAPRQNRIPVALGVVQFDQGSAFAAVHQIGDKAGGCIRAEVEDFPVRVDVRLAVDAETIVSTLEDREAAICLCRRHQDTQGIACRAAGCLRGGGRRYGIANRSGHRLRLGLLGIRRESPAAEPCNRAHHLDLHPVCGRHELLLLFR